MTTTNIDPRDIRERAFLLWEQRGRPQGGAEEDWYEAERQLRVERGENGERVTRGSARDDLGLPSPDPTRTDVTITDMSGLEPRGPGTVLTDAQVADEASKESFPASDSPGQTGLPDTPPANADEKWAAAEQTKPKRRRAKNGPRRS